MKFTISESSIKKFIKHKLGLDLTDNFKIITNYEDLPYRFKRLLPKVMVNKYFNLYGPMFVIQTDSDIFLYQKQGGGSDIFIDKHDMVSSEFEILNALGVDKLGIPLDDLISIYLNE